MPAQAIRFGVINPGRTQRSATWKLWTPGKGELYLAVRRLGGVLKMSMHTGGGWRIAFTKEKSAEMLSDRPTGQRTLAVWEPPAPRAPGLQVAATIRTPSSAVTEPIGSKDRNVLWIEQPDSEYMTEFAVLILAVPEEAAAARVEVVGYPILGSFPLESRTMAAVVWRNSTYAPPHLAEGRREWHFAKGHSKEDLLSGSPRMLTWAFDERGSPVFYEAPVTVKLPA